MTRLDVLATAQRLRDRGEPFCLVSVLHVQPPASARAGDKAVVTALGIADGWIGGGCAQPVVLRAVKQALADGRPRLIRISPADEGHERELQDVLEFGMACHSGGTLELFVDPVLPRDRLVVVGDSPLAAALTALAPRVGLPVTVVAQDADATRFADADRVIASDDAQALPEQVAPGAWVVVATQGRRDVQGLRAALALQAARVFFVASARKAQVLKASLVAAGSDAAAVDAIVAPAGASLGAQTPEEIALSVLVAVVAARRGVPIPGPAPATAPRVAPEPATPNPAATSACCGGPVVALEALPPLPPVKSSCCGGGA